jgi:hypothetical protein
MSEEYVCDLAMDEVERKSTLTPKVDTGAWKPLDANQSPVLSSQSGRKVAGVTPYSRYCGLLEALTLA